MRAWRWRVLSWLRRDRDPSGARMVHVHLVLSDGSKHRTSRRIPRYDADLVLHGFGSEHVPTFLIRVLGDRRVVSARLGF